MEKAEKHIPRVAVVVLNWKGLKDTLECLASLSKISYPDFEIVVADNGSGSAEVDALRNQVGKDTKFIRNDKNYGFAGGNNIAWRWLENHSKAEYFLLLNNDILVAPDFLNEMVAVAESDSSIAVVGPKTYFVDPPNMIQIAWGRVNMWTGTPTQVGSNAIDQGQFDQQMTVGHIQGSCMLLRRSVVNEIGLFDETYFCYWEETDFCYRVKKAGYKVVYAPASRIWHKKNSTLRPKWYKALFIRDRHLPPYTEIHLLTRNNFVFMHKNAEKLQYVMFLLYYFCITFWYRLFIYILYYRKAYILKAFFRGIREGLVWKPTPA